MIENGKRQRRIIKTQLLIKQMPINQNNSVNQDEIASIAFILWDQAGRPSGRDLEFWLSAERRVIAHQTPADNPAPSPSSPNSSSLSRMDYSTERLDARSSSTGTYQPNGKNGANPTAKPADRSGQPRAKKATSSVT
jgi:hypothetical protein